ncbi:3',5'-cyclic AMP phosphodiesterase CpdA [Lentibacillus halodurans]|uniref:3',5'-cyclic AMP phosphodiesterase CpdA n=1 Tax=Lentibacillus halodurans TaxID=237679 RepID=A0A1I0Y5W7_9BACI|nr:metallophosphoesterase [Lentibacillus halodurans]SFB08689.1 3',5'-cyclic AMP phosphodiesterase CpdA [Lentibacillus halodurans]
MRKIAKKSFKLPVSLIAILLGLTILTYPHNAEASSPGVPGNNPELVFPVISDTQISNDSDLEKFNNALNQLNELSPNQDAFVFLGDLTDNGYTEQYDNAMEVYEENRQDGTQSLFAIGNHEYYNDANALESQERFLEKTGMDSLYYHKVIKDYDFVVMGEEDEGYFSKQQINWLDEQLSKAEQRDSKKPIFVFMHWPIEDTTYGSEWHVEPNGELLYETLEKYPQVVFFSGHTHYPVSDPKSIYQKDFTSVNTGSVNYMWTENGYLQGHLPPGHDEVSNGLLVEVYNNRVIIKRRGFHSNDWLGDPWVIKTPAKTNKFKYTSDRDNKKPYFKKGSSVSINQDKTTSTELYAEFQQASDNILVHSYQVTAVNKMTGETAKEYTAFSEYYKDSVPEKLELPISGLKPGNEYEINIKAIDAFGNISDESLTTVGNTKK